MNVYQCINQVQAALAKTGIAKDRQCQQGASFMYRGIDEVYNTLSPLLSKYGLCILPRIISRQCDERKSAKGTALFYVVVEAEFDLVSAEDGTMHIVRSFGEAMDSGDKATNKAMSIAYKNAIFMAFSVPTQGDNDPDSQAHEVAPHAGMLLEEVDLHLDAMNNSSGVVGLQEKFRAAWESAGKAKDTNARAAFKSAYDRLMAERTDAA